MNPPPYDAYSPCPKCGRTTARSEKPVVKYCSGIVEQQRPGAGPPVEMPCHHGCDVEHLVRGCYDCHYEWVEAVIGEPPLTGAEIALLRKALVSE